jgi:hypothetical protein
MSLRLSPNLAGLAGYYTAITSCQVIKPYIGSQDMIKWNTAWLIFKDIWALVRLKPLLHKLSR